MVEFIEMPASKKSLSFRKPVFGVGTNDADYIIDRRIDGKRVACPIYRAWKNMLKRCHSDKYQKDRPTYIGCSVCKEWLTFSNFRRWMLTQDWQGKQIDKDIKFKGNKIYSPETCMFVTNKENTIEARAMHYVFISPLGEAVKIYNLSEFCRNNGLDQGNMCKVYSGKAKHHKGWTLANKGSKNEH